MVYPHYGNVSYSASGSISTNINRRLIYDLNKNVLTVDGKTLSCTATTFTSAASLCLFTTNTNGTIYSPKPSGYFYSCKIYDNDTLVRDFVPCVNSSGTVGIYDLVNSQFYTNAGTGEFVAGSTCLSVSKRIKKAYIGIGGKARPFLVSGVESFGEITELVMARYGIKATSIGNYALFAGGYNSSDSSASAPKRVDIYTQTLTHLTRSMTYGR